MGGTIARYSAEGARVVLVTCTRGEVGEISDPALATPEHLAEVRARELAHSVRVLGIQRAVQLGYRDSGMAGTADNDNPASFHRASLEEAAERVVAVIREERPQVVVTYDAFGGYGLPDHIKAHQVAGAAFHAAGDASRFPNAGAPWAPAKLYYSVFPRSAMQRLGEGLRAMGVEPPWAGREDVTPRGASDEEVTTLIDVTSYVDAKRASFDAHPTQMPKGSFFTRLTPDFMRQYWSHETFQLVEAQGISRSPGKESDLFEGT